MNNTSPENNGFKRGINLLGWGTLIAAFTSVYPEKIRILTSTLALSLLLLGALVLIANRNSRQ